MKPLNQVPSSFYHGEWHLKAKQKSPTGRARNYCDVLKPT